MNKSQSIAIVASVIFTSRILESTLLMYEIFSIRLHITAVTAVEMLRNQKRLRKHLSKEKHIRNAVQESGRSRNLPHKCKECDETFHGKKQLKKHMSSHRPRHIHCPMGGKCNKKFATPSALLNHLESGCCSSGVTRAKIHQLVFAHDSNRYITSVEAAEPIRSAEHASASQISHVSDLVESSSDNLPGNKSPPLPSVSNDDSLSEWSDVGHGPLTFTTSDSDWSIIGGDALTPAHSDNASEWSFMNEDLVHISSNMFPFDTRLDISSHNGTISQKRRCHLCGPNRKPFLSVRAYQEHVNSAAHSPKIFHCPLSFMPKVTPEDKSKIRRFSSLGGLTQHLESGRCEGGLEMYSKAISFVEEQLKLLGFSGFMLSLPPTTQKLTMMDG
ncbi:uncharacterized protein PAC_11731 [Phialocephala subalpina]|uniref:C2H2-type domain-containing protein n=1 Tax=Phialocephala subalpina TaxID=576137 RepID=A0A1L7X9Y5_9HELO|nr:uncharacterized protein PAC_11731 [Phialocephala subalpina]